MGILGKFVVMGNAGFISSTVVSVGLDNGVSSVGCIRFCIVLPSTPNPKP